MKNEDKAEKINTLEKELAQMTAGIETTRKWIGSGDLDDFLKIYREVPPYPPEEVGFNKISEMLNSKWKHTILMRLHKHDSMRYSEIKKSLEEYGIVDYMLSRSLKELIDDKLVEKTVYPEVPPHTEYKVTRKAQELLLLTVRCSQWYNINRAEELTEEIEKLKK